MQQIINYKCVDIKYSTTTGMATADVRVKQPAVVVDSNNKPSVAMVPKDEKLYGRLKDVKAWISKRLSDGLLEITSPVS